MLKKVSLLVICIMLVSLAGCNLGSSSPAFARNATSKANSSDNVSQLELIEMNFKNNVSIPIYLPSGLPPVRDSYYYITSQKARDGYVVDFYVVNNNISQERFVNTLGPTGGGVPISGEIAAGSLYNEHSVPWPNPPYFNEKFSSSDCIVVSGVPLTIQKNLAYAFTTYSINGYRVILEVQLIDYKRQVDELFNMVFPYLQKKQLPSNSIISINFTNDKPYNCLWWRYDGVRYNLVSYLSPNDTLGLVSSLVIK